MVTLMIWEKVDMNSLRLQEMLELELHVAWLESPSKTEAFECNIYILIEQNKYVLGIFTEILFAL